MQVSKRWPDGAEQAVDGYTVVCLNLGCIMCSDEWWCDTEAEAAEAWNTRAERTCRMEYQTGKDNPKRGWWLCNQCGGLTDSAGGRWDGRRQRIRPPAHCACCGAKVEGEGR